MTPSRELGEPELCAYVLRTILDLISTYILYTPIPTNKSCTRSGASFNTRFFTIRLYISRHALKYIILAWNVRIYKLMQVGVCLYISISAFLSLLQSSQQLSVFAQGIQHSAGDYLPSVIHSRGTNIASGRCTLYTLAVNQGSEFLVVYL
ncbi:uncharacterized protein BDW43DRAFT_284224, partial [Aspergillus alliaceus]|uniref:uncharacterized protein n=1 Tax=Petromyces alliaceus TaxID=209559 RepID=UPI0012A641B2